MMIRTRHVVMLVAVAVLLFAPSAQATGVEETGGHGVATTFLWITILLLAAKFSSLVERFGQPAVLGELVIGVILGNLVLLGLPFFEPIKQDTIVTFLAQLGVVILLFQIGLESNIRDMRRVGLSAFLVAIVGVVVPFVSTTYFIGPLLLPGLPANTYLFLGAAMTATSVGITARIFQDLGKLQSPEAQIVLGAAVIDDVLGLIILAVVSAIATSGTVSPAEVGWIIMEAVLFLAGAIFIGQLLAPRLGKLFSTIHPGVGMKFTLAISFALIFAYLAQEIGLAPIVGAFAAGLVLDPIHFRHFENTKIVHDLQEVVKEAGPELKESIHTILETHNHRHVEDLVAPLGLFLVPLFFVVTGMEVRLETMFNLPILTIALGVTVVAFVGKIVAGLAAGKVSKVIVGWGMVPRGEVGLIFATIGKSLGVVSDEVFSVIVIVVILTTLLTPPVLTFLLKRQPPSDLSRLPSVDTTPTVTST